ncbi:hypothetical protein DRH13_04920 [Candidatus Woesebacteria bacterium]|nr:MAG: hypothetical protein DRH13_04920 [Candidatus Woesebacteria bacterium]
MDDQSNLSQRGRQMYALIEKSQNSPLSQKAFCEQEDLPLSTFTYWLKKYHEFKQSAGALEDFIPMKISERSPQKQSNWCEIEFPGGIVIRIGGF